MKKKKKAKKLLYKQLKLLAKQSKKSFNEDLSTLSHSIVEIAQILFKAH